MMIIIKNNSKEDDGKNREDKKNGQMADQFYDLQTCIISSYRRLPFLVLLGDIYKCDFP